MKKHVLIMFIFIVFMFFSACAQTDEQVNEEITQNTLELINYNWQLHNIKISYKDYKKEAEDFFNDKEYEKHIDNSELNPLILEDVRKIDEKQIEKYADNKNYNIINGKISKVYGDINSGKKHIYIHMIIVPHTPNNKEEGIAYTSGGSTLNEERNILLIYTPDKKGWKISDIQANSYLENLKDKLSNEFVSRYTTHNNTPVEYIQEFEYVN